MFENYQKSRAIYFRHFPLIFVQLKLTCLVTLFDHGLKLQAFKNSPNWTNFHKNVNVTCDFWGDFQTLCHSSLLRYSKQTLYFFRDTPIVSWLGSMSNPKKTNHHPAGKFSAWPTTLPSQNVWKLLTMCRIWSFAFSTNFWPILKGGAFLVTLFDRKLQVFKSSPK